MKHRLIRLAIVLSNVAVLAYVTGAGRKWR